MNRFIRIAVLASFIPLALMSISTKAMALDGGATQIPPQALPPLPGGASNGKNGNPFSPIDENKIGSDLTGTQLKWPSQDDKGLPPVKVANTQASIQPKRDYSKPHGINVQALLKSADGNHEAVMNDEVLLLGDKIPHRKNTVWIEICKNGSLLMNTGEQVKVGQELALKEPMMNTKSKEAVKCK